MATGWIGHGRRHFPRAALVPWVMLLAMAAPAPADEEGKKVDPKGRDDALTLLFYPDTPRDPEWKPRWPPIVTGEWNDLGPVEKVAKATETRQMEPPAPTTRYPWQTALWDAAGAFLDGTPTTIDSPWKAEWYFFPAAEGNTMAWLTFTLPQPLAEGERLVAILRSEDDEDSGLVLGTDRFPFLHKKTSTGLIAQAARSLPPGRYAVVAGVAGGEGTFTPRFQAFHIVSRVPTDQLRLSKILLAESIRELKEDETAAAPFRVSGFEVVPKGSSTVRRGEDLTIFYQVLGAGEQAGGADFDVTYQLYIRPPGKPGAGWVRAGRPVVAAHQSGAARAWTLGIAPQFPVAHYRLEVSVKDNAGGAKVSQNVHFQVVD
ncbi:MAG: hypothetical protein Q9Q40_10295 [Acidobacteriota bacterium]|nr:hypothetical protein [Acidobacteriota bacterium]MDQ7088754.1 hypothetical protein [Acidobacteriota bacterium]